MAIPRCSNRVCTHACEPAEEDTGGPAATTSRALPTVALPPSAVTAAVSATISLQQLTDQLEALEADPDAVARQWSIGTVILGGVEYVIDCKCWHAPAMKCIEWMDENAHQVAAYLSLEKNRKQDEANRSPLVRAPASATIGEDARDRINP